MKSRKMAIREKKGNKFFSFLFSAFLIILAGIFIFSNMRIREEIKRLTLRKNTLAQTVESLQKEREKLEQGLSQSERSIYWEEKIRKQGYQKPGEKVVIIKKPAVAQETEITAPENPNSSPQNFFQKMLAFVKSIF